MIKRSATGMTSYAWLLLLIAWVAADAGSEALPVRTFVSLFLKSAMVASIRVPA